MNPEAKTNPVVAVISAFLFPGAGFLYLGMPLHALATAILPFVVLVVSSLSIHRWLTGYWLSMGFLLLWQLVTILATFVYQKRHLKGRDAWFYSGAFTIGLAVVLSLSAQSVLPNLYSKIARYRPFSSPSASMEPTIQIGDRFIVDSSWYKDHSVQLGDLVAYENPDDYQVLYIKRIVALAGDTIEVKAGRLIRNGQEEITHSFHPIQAQPINFLEDSCHLYNMLPTSVPVGSVFCVGDNRGNSLDSRYHGPIKIESIHGKAIYTWWPIRNIKTNYE